MMADQNTYGGLRFVASGAPFILKRHASFLHFCFGGWALGGFPSLAGLGTGRSAIEGVINGLGEHGVESLGAGA
jgi:hypothetical protein